MTAHPEFEQIAEIIFAEKIDKEYFRKAAQINAHICACSECKKIYEVMLTAHDQAEAYVRCQAMQAEADAVAEQITDAAEAELITGAPEQAIGAVEATQAVGAQTKPEQRPSRIDQLIHSGYALVLKVQSMTQIVADGLQMQHPLRPVMVKAMGADSRGGEPLQSVLTDGAGNRIRIDEDGSLTLYFERNLLKPGEKATLIRLGEELDGEPRPLQLGRAVSEEKRCLRMEQDHTEPKETGGQQKLVGTVTEYDQNTTRVCFEGISPGTFHILLG